jgi:hypothetical protein
MTEEKAKSKIEETKGQSKETKDRARETTGEITGQATETVAGLTGQATESLGSFICEETTETKEGLVADLEAGTEIDKTKCKVEGQKEEK